AYEIRARLKLPDATESLRNWAEMNFKLGQCDTAQAQFLKVMEAGRAAGDKADVALAASTMGMLFAAQGKYEAALSSLHDAVSGFQQLNDRTWYSAEALARYGDVLSMVGRGEEAQKYLDEALQRAVELKDDAVTAGVLTALGDSYFYRGQYPSARQQYERALKALGKSRLTEEVLRARLGMARVDVEQGKAQAAAPALKKIVQDANSMGLEAISVQASIDYAAALLASKQADAARPVLETALGQAGKAGLLLQQARADYLLGE